MQCPYCKKDLSHAMRLLGDEVFPMHVKMHEADLISSILRQIDEIEWHYQTVQPKVTKPLVIKDLLIEYHNLKQFHKIIEGSQNEAEKV